jgi:hypothetical protein
MTANDDGEGASSRREYLKLMGLAAGFGGESAVDGGGDFALQTDHDHLGETWKGDVGDGAGLLVIADPGRTGLAGANLSTSGNTFGLRGRADSPSGTGLKGLETSSTGLARGVDGRTKSEDGQALRGFADTTSGNATGVYGRTDAPSGTAVFGDCRDGSGKTTGVYGKTDTSDRDSVAVYGEAADRGTGVVAVTNDTDLQSAALNASNQGDGRGIVASSNNFYGIEASTTSTFPSDAAVYGDNNGAGYGVLGESENFVGVSGSGPDGGIEGFHTGSSTSDAGVRGISTDGVGVRGESDNDVGVRALGPSNGTALVASTTSPPPADEGFGNAIYAETDQASNYPVKARNTDGGIAIDASGDVSISGDLDATGTKSFVQTAPNGKEVTYSAVESGDVRTETAGVAQLEDGSATVELPDHFGWVTDASEELVVTLTPYGGTDGLKVVSRSVEAIEVAELGENPDGNYEFAYEVSGIREGYADRQVVSDPSEEPGEKQAQAGPPDRLEPDPTKQPAPASRGAKERGRGDEAGRAPPKPPTPPVAPPGEAADDPAGPPRKDEDQNGGGG